MGTDASQRPTIPVALPDTPSGIGVKQFALTSTALWFESTFCNNSGAAHQWCLLDWWNGAYQYCNNFRYIRGTVYADTGDVTLIVSGTYGAQLSVGHGYYRYYWADGGSSGRVSERYDPHLARSEPGLEPTARICLSAPLEFLSARIHTKK